MSSPEMIDENRRESDFGSGETPVATLRERGEKTLSVAEREALLREKELLLARKAEIEKELALLSEPSVTQDEAEPENSTISENIDKDTSTDAPEDSAPPEKSTPPEVTTSPENPRRAKIEYIKKKSKSNSSCRDVVIGAATIALAAFLGVAIGTNGFDVNHRNNQSYNNMSNSTAVTQTAHAEATPSPNGISTTEQPQNLSDSENVESKKGIKDGYGEPGLWLSENKDHDYDYGDAKEVGEICDHDEVEMLKYAANNQVESLADYMAEFPEELCPEGFYGLNPRAIE